MPADKDSIANTFIVATSVCLVCSLVISAAAVGLRSIQERNIALDKKKNILQVAGFEQSEIAKVGIEKLFEDRFESTIINLDTGESADQEEMKPIFDVMKLSGEEGMTKYDPIKAAKSKDTDNCCDAIEKTGDIAGLKYRERYSFVYRLMSESGNEIEAYVFPIRGYGLWSTLKGYLAVRPDFQTIVGITYYEHAETPGLGGEVDNPGWKAKWHEKKIYDEQRNVKVSVIKGSAGDDPYSVDGLSGATITSKGVTNMLQYWLGPSGFGPYIEKQKTGSKTANKQLPGGSNG